MQKNTKNRLYVHIKIRSQFEKNQGLTQKPREIVLSTPEGKKTLSARHARYYCSAPIEPKPRPSCPGGLPVKPLAFPQTTRVRRDIIIENRREFHRYRYSMIHIMYSEWQVGHEENRINVGDPCTHIRSIQILLANS